MGRLRIGTCSWKYPSWAGLVYSAPRGINYLEEYARQYDTVEVDQWFWSLFEGGEPKLPQPSEVEEYVRSVPSDFRFTVKVPNAITLTHYYTKSKSDPLVANPHFLSPDLFARYLSLLEPLGESLGPLLLQFEYLNRQKMSGQAEFQDRLGRFLSQIPAGRPYALEVRNANYLNQALFEFMNSKNLVPVLLQGYWMPPIGELFARLHDAIVEARTVVLRLHGPDRKGMEKEAGGQWDRLVVQRDDELESVARITGELLEAGADVYVNVNNHFEGSAPITLRRLLELLDRKGRTTKE